MYAWAKLDVSEVVNKTTAARKTLKTAIRKGSRAGLRPVLDSAKKNAPKKTGHLRKHIVLRALPRSRVRIGSKVSMAFVPPVDKKQQGKENQFYGRFQEGGWQWKPNRRQRGYQANRKERRKITPNGRNIAPKNFIKNAYSSKGKPGLAIAVEVAGKVIKDAFINA